MFLKLKFFLILILKISVFLKSKQGGSDLLPQPSCVAAIHWQRLWGPAWLFTCWHGDQKSCLKPYTKEERCFKHLQARILLTLQTVLLFSRYDACWISGVWCSSSACPGSSARLAGVSDTDFSIFTKIAVSVFLTFAYTRKTIPLLNWSCF